MRAGPALASRPIIDLAGDKWVSPAGQPAPSNPDWSSARLEMPSFS